MLSHKAILASLDAIIALPIASAAILLLLGSYHSNLSQLSSIAYIQTSELKLYSKSQALVQMLKYLNLNYSETLSTADNYSGLNQINLTIMPIANASLESCSGIYACRLLEIGNYSYLMVLKNEDSS